MARPTKKAKEAVPAKPYLVPVEAYGAPPKTKDRPSWIQFISSRLATGLLIYLCAVSALFIGIWAWTLPSIADLQITETQGIDVDKVFERFYAARRSHFNDIRDMYLLVMGTTLAPALSLLFGHAFGRAQESGRDDETNENT